MNRLYGQIRYDPLVTPEALVNEIRCAIEQDLEEARQKPWFGESAKSWLEQLPNDHRSLELLFHGSAIEAYAFRFRLGLTEEIALAIEAKEREIKRARKSAEREARRRKEGERERRKSSMAEQARLRAYARRLGTTVENVPQEYVRVRSAINTVENKLREAKSSERNHGS